MIERLHRPFTFALFLSLLLAAALPAGAQTYVTHAFLLNADGPALIDINGA